MNKAEEILALYKLHATLADNVTKHRGASNALYLSLVSGLLVVYVGQIGNIGIPVRTFVAISSILGILLAVSWIISIDHYRKLNTAKFILLHKLEQQLVFDFFTQEWDFLKRNKSRYFDLTRIEKILPLLFITAYVVLWCYFYYRI